MEHPMSIGMMHTPAMRMRMAGVCIIHGDEQDEPLPLANAWLVTVAQKT